MSLSHHFLGTALIALLFFIANSDPGWTHGSYHSRVHAASKQVEEEPTSATAWLERAMIHAQSQNWKSAESDLERVAQLDPHMPELDLVRGKAMATAGQHGLAISHLTAFLSQKSDHVSALVARAQLLVVIGEPAAAARDYDRIISVNKGAGPDLFVKRAQAHVAAKDPVRALKGLREGADRLGPIVSLHLAMVDIQIKAENYDDALESLDAMIRVSPGQATWQARRGDVLLKAGRDSQAEEAYRLALESINRLPDRNRRAPANISLEKSLINKLAAAGR
jgi:tetratricopeptide (TPR) repeat protein